MLYKILENNCILPGEKWVTNIYNSDYQVSNLGRVKNKFGHLLGFKDDKGYIKSYLTTHNKYGQGIPVHRQVYFSFNPQLFEHEQDFIIDHINGKRDDNRLDNLRLLTIAENNQERDKNQNAIRTLTGELVLKYGYDKTIEKLTEWLNEN